jgi:acetyltransferase
MTVRNLEYLFRPGSIAVIAEPDEPSRYADIVQRNLAAGGFAGPLAVVAARRVSRLRLGPRVRVDPLPFVPDLALICAHFDSIPAIVAQLGERGVRAAIIGPSIRDKLDGPGFTAVRKAILEAARPHLMRLLGSGSGGLMVPGLGINASVSPVAARPGKIALVAQSASVGMAIIDRAASTGVGFSTIVHLGASLDIDLADAIDWLADDPDTERILVQFDSVAVGRKFMSAARAAARNKPVVAIRGGRVVAEPASTAPFSRGDVYDAALRRAGWVSIPTLGDILEALEAMARIRPMAGDRLAIAASGSGLGSLAVEALMRRGGKRAVLASDTVRRLAGALKTNSPPGNPLVLPPGAGPAAWGEVVAALLADGGSDAVMTVCSPSPFAPPAEVAVEIGRACAGSERNVFTCWVGGDSMLEAQRIVAEHGQLAFDSPERGVAAFAGLLDYYRNRELLMQMPQSLPEGYATDTATAHAVAGEALAAGADMLTARQAGRLLQAYGIGAAEYTAAASVEAAIEVANTIGYPVDLSLMAGGSEPLGETAGELRSPADIQAAVRNLRAAVRNAHPGLRLHGYRLRRSAARRIVPPLRIGVAEDKVFGPVIYLGPSVHAGDGRVVVGLPPLNLNLAQDLVARSRFAEDVPAELRGELEEAASNALVRLSQLLTEVDEVVAIDIDPLNVEPGGVVALEAAVRIEKRGRHLGLRRFAIRPYPKELERRFAWEGRQLLLRPIRPEDENTLAELLNSLAAEDSRMRFFDTMRKLPRTQLARFTQIDYEREMALVAIETDADGHERSLGEVRAVADPDNVVAEFALVVESSLKGKGLGRLLMASIIDYARTRGIHELRGETLAGNLRMQGLARHCGFSVQAGADPGTVDLRLVLQQNPDTR